MRFDSPKSWIQYPMELTKQEFVQKGDDENYGIEGTYQVTIETMIKTVMQWELILKVLGPLQDGAFYQVYVQIDSNQGDAQELPYYESFQFTLLYQEDIQGAMTEANTWIISYCDTVVFSEVDTGNYKEVERLTNKCTANPAYIFDAKRSKTEDETEDGYSRIKVYFERSLKQRGMQDLYVNSDIKYRVGFNVYDDAELEKSEEGSTETLPMIIPYKEPEKEKPERKILTRKVKVDCIPGVSTNPRC